MGETGRSRASGTGIIELDKNLLAVPMTSQYIERANATRLRWVDYIFSKAKENGIIPVWWDNGYYNSVRSRDQFGLINRNNGKPNSDESAEVIRTIMSAVR